MSIDNEMLKKKLAEFAQEKVNIAFFGPPGEGKVRRRDEPSGGDRPHELRRGLLGGSGPGVRPFGCAEGSGRALPGDGDGRDRLLPPRPARSSVGG